MVQVRNSEDIETNSFKVFSGAWHAVALCHQKLLYALKPTDRQGAETHWLCCGGLTPSALRYFQLRNPGSIEHDRLVSVGQDSPLQMEAHRAGKDDALDIAPFAYQILHGIAVADADDVLFDDRPFI